MLKDVNLAQDATQEAFLNLWKNRKGIDPTKSIRSYLKTATINRSLNIIKSRNHHMGDGPASLDWLTSPDQTPLQINESRELKEMITEAVDQLPERCRLIFVLGKYEGHSYKQIATQLNITPKTVENQMSKALKFLRKALSPLVKTFLFVIILNTAWVFSQFEL